MVKRLKEYLDQHSIKYQIITHSIAYTSQEIAAMAHISGQQMAKVVIIKTDGEMFMTVLPATHVVDLKRVEEISGFSHVELATEAQYSAIFEDCEPGAMPPFGNLYNLKVYVSTSLTQDEQIAFNAGSHRELVKLSYKDFEKLVRPQTAAFSIKDSHRT